MFCREPTTDQCSTDPLLSQSAAPMEPTFTADAHERFVENAVPVLDNSDPTKLMQLISTGDLFMEALVGTEENSSNTIDNNDKVSDIIDEVFIVARSLPNIKIK